MTYKQIKFVPEHIIRRLAIWAKIEGAYIWSGKMLIVALTWEGIITDN